MKKRRKQSKRKEHASGEPQLTLVSWNDNLIKYLWKLWAAFGVGQELGPPSADWNSVIGAIWLSYRRELLVVLTALGCPRNGDLERSAQAPGLTAAERADRQVRLIRWYVEGLTSLRDVQHAYTPWLARSLGGVNYGTASASLAMILEQVGVQTTIAYPIERMSALLIRLPTGHRLWVDPRDGTVSPLMVAPTEDVYLLDEDHSRRFGLYRPRFVEIPLHEGLLWEVLQSLVTVVTTGLALRDVPQQRPLPSLPCFGIPPLIADLPAELRQPPFLALFGEIIDRSGIAAKIGSFLHRPEMEAKKEDDAGFTLANFRLREFYDPLLEVLGIDRGSSFNHHFTGAILYWSNYRQDPEWLVPVIHGEKPIPNDLHPKAREAIALVRDRLHTGGPELWKKLPSHFAIMQAESEFKQAINGMQ